LSVKVENKQLSLHQLLMKFYGKGKDDEVVQKDVEFHQAEERIDIGFVVEHIFISLLSKLDGELLDWWEHSPYRQPSRLKIEQFTPRYVQELATQGENENVELKPGFREDRNKKEIAESAIAFANKKGGVILVGVNDNTIIEGAFGDGWEELITQSLRDRCEPPIELTVHRVDIEDKPVYVIRIEESTNKPHQLKDAGVIYIRASSSDRPATRYELDEIYAGNENKPYHPDY